MGLTAISLQCPRRVLTRTTAANLIGLLRAWILGPSQTINSRRELEWHSTFRIYARCSRSWVALISAIDESVRASTLDITLLAGSNVPCDDSIGSQHCHIPNRRSGRKMSEPQPKEFSLTMEVFWQRVVLTIKVANYAGLAPL